MPFACIFVPDFAVQALLRAEPHLRMQAFAIIQGKAPLQKIFAMNENARSAGVDYGMTKLQAETCSGLVLRERSLEQESAAHAALLECAQSFSPRIEDTALDTVILDLAGMESLFGPLHTIARDLMRRASELGLEGSVAVADNADTAMLAARGFSSVTVVPDGKEEEQLGSLPVEVLFAGNKDEEAAQLLQTFERWGIRDLRELAALPDIALSERLGERGLLLQKLARGKTARTLVPVDPPLNFEEVIEVEHPLVLLEPFAFLLNEMLEQLCTRLSAHALATQELRLELELVSGWRSEDELEICTHSSPELALGLAPSTSLSAGLRRRPSPHEQFRRTIRLPGPMLDSKTFLKLLQLDLKAHPPGAPISKIRLTAEPARPRPSQNGFFLPSSPEPEKLELTLARIVSIVGEDKVGSLQILDTHRREGFRMQRFTENADVIPSRSKPRSRGESVSRNLQCSADSEELQIPRSARDDKLIQCTDLVTALRILRPPLVVTTILREGRPVQVHSKKHGQIQGDILWAAGPWRSSGDWWVQDGWSRDEWDIALQQESGIAFYRLVHDLLSGRWLLAGSYD
jgi:protein ImuB